LGQVEKGDERWSQNESLLVPFMRIVVVSQSIRIKFNPTLEDAKNQDLCFKLITLTYSNEQLKKN
jgi:hypothetical protein